MSGFKQGAHRASAVLVALAAAGIQGQAWASTWYVAPGGTGRGTQQAPYGKIQDAANAAKAGDVISVAPGTYHEAVVVTHSGTASAPIVFRSQQPGAAVVSGADPVGTLTSGGPSGSWRSGTVPAFSSSLGQDEQCFAGRTRLPMARWPATSADTLSSPAQAIIKNVSNVAVLGYDSLTQMWIVSSTITLDRNTLPAGDWTYALVELTPGVGYDQVSGAVMSVDASGTLPVLSIIYYTHTDVIAPGNEFYLSGVVAGLATAPGQWVRSGQNVLVRAPADANPNSADIECKQRDFAFDLTGQSYVTLDGFGIFAASVTTDRNSGDPAEGPSTWTLHTGQGNVAAANHIVLTGLSVDTPNSIRNLFGNVWARWTNNTGVVLSGSSNTLQNSVILHSDGNGVSLAGSGNKVIGNRISESNLVGCECAGISTGYRGYNSISGQTPQQWAWTWNLGEEIASNIIERSGRALINVSALASTTAAPSRVHHNFLSGAVLQTYDNGAIYSTAFPGETAYVPQTGLEIDHNIITASPVGIYLDVYSNGFLMHHNIITGPGEPGLADSLMILNSGRNHLIYNNTLIAESNYSYAIWDWLPVFGDSGNLVRNNIMRVGAALACMPGCQDHSLVWDGVAGSSTDPRVNNFTTVDFSLAAGSPAINAGVAIPGITDDSRSGSQIAVGLPDEGAMESSATSWVPATSSDRTAPGIVMSAPVEGATYIVNQTVKAYYNCSDEAGGSGIARCTGTMRNREAIDTASTGAKTFSVTATDRAGNQVTVLRHYTVSN